MARSLIQIQNQDEITDQEIKSAPFKCDTESKIENLAAKLRQMDTNGDEKISFVEFFTAVQSEPSLLKCFYLTNNVLDDRFNDAHLLMNIRSKGKSQKRSNTDCILS
jgi:hypothetical protein